MFSCQKYNGFLFILAFSIFYSTLRCEYSDHSDYTLLPSGNIKELRCGKFYYRTFYKDENRDTLYVGAMDRILALNLHDITVSSCQDSSLIMLPTSSRKCISRGKTPHYDCRNHIRVIQPIGTGDLLYVCGTNAHDPRDSIIYANMTRYKSPAQQLLAGIGDGIAKCPFDPDDNSTAIWVREGNLGDLPALYSATVAEFTNADTVIFRTDLYEPRSRIKRYSFKRTLKYDSKWLDKPNFVASYDIGEYVYFFFRESALEYINCGKAIYSRVARVCKQDNGGSNILNQNWATYVKARLNCSLPGEFPFYFNEIQSVYKLSDDDSRLFAVFTTSLNGLIGSAVCTYDLHDIQAAFDGRFKEQRTSSSAWLPVRRSAVPSPRPGVCVNDTKRLPDSVLTFIQSHPLMDSAVAHRNRMPVYHVRDVIFTQIVVEKLVLRVFGYTRVYYVYYIGTYNGMIYKVIEWQNDSSSSTSSVLLDIFQASRSEPIRQMAISARHKSLYVASDSQILQINLQMCGERFDNCLRCVTDPYCGWDRTDQTCKPYDSGLLQDVAGTKLDICDSSALKRHQTVSWGETLHLGCNIKLPYSLGQHGISEHGLDWYLWTKDRGQHKIVESNSASTKHVWTRNNGLVVLSASEADAGRYEARLGARIACMYTVSVETHRCNAPSKAQDYQKIYSEWCNEYEKYKQAMKLWQERQNQCRTSKDLKSPSNLQTLLN